MTNCGCKVSDHIIGHLRGAVHLPSGVWIEYCPTHKAAPDLLNAVTRALTVLQSRKTGILSPRHMAIDILSHALGLLTEIK